MAGTAGLSLSAQVPAGWAGLGRSQADVDALVQHAARRRGPTTFSLALALPVAGASGWLVAGSVSAFREQRTTVDPVAVGAASSLVTRGPSRLTRNPMYAGMAGLLLAHATARRSPASLLPALAFVWVVDRCQVPAEEEALAARFGQAWDDYQRSVPRWLGRGSVAALRARLLRTSQERRVMAALRGGWC